MESIGFRISGFREAASLRSIRINNPWALFGAAGELLQFRV